MLETGAQIQVPLFVNVGDVVRVDTRSGDYVVPRLMARRTEQRRAAVWALYQSDLLGRPLEETFPRDAHGFTRALAERGPRAPARARRADHRATRAAGRSSGSRRSSARSCGSACSSCCTPRRCPGEQAIPPEGAIDEAVETAKEFCGADAPGFVNGILAAVLRERENSGGCVLRCLRCRSTVNPYDRRGASRCAG